MWIGQQGREVYKKFSKSVIGSPSSLQWLLKKIEDYIRPRQNKRVSRFRAHQRKQDEGESFDNFVKDSKLLIMDCEYDDPDDILIDLIISGVIHEKVQLRLLDQGQKLTLSKAIEIGQQYEMSQSQVKMFRGQEVLTIKRQSHNVLKQKSKDNSDKLCSKCGKNHEKEKCPAIGTTCNFCKKKNHWFQMCRKRRNVNLVEDDSHSDENVIPVNTASSQYKKGKIENINVVEDK
uniref:Retrotransposon gag domain-containing protein n=1 Tax=Biomphalaria glabrata TaxID=6526 RepID=A0A2C9LYX4_BIOGL